MVRLEFGNTAIAYDGSILFQFLNGAIGVISPEAIVTFCKKFQFLNGAIGVIKSRIKTKLLTSFNS